MSNSHFWLEWAKKYRGLSEKYSDHITAVLEKRCLLNSNNKKVVLVLQSENDQRG